MKIQSAPFPSSLPISATQWESLTDALLDLGVDEADVGKLAEMTSAPNVCSVQSLRLAVDAWVKSLKIECAHGLCNVDSRTLNGTVIPMIDKFLGNLNH